MLIGIENIEYFLPDKSITSKELASDFGFSLSFIEGKIGVKRIFVAEEKETTSDLAVEAVKKILKNRPDVKNKIGVIVLCTQTPDFQLPHTAAIVQKKLGLGNDIASFDLSLGCSGFVYGLSVIRSFMGYNKLEYGILVTAETYSKIIDCQDKNTKPLFSDASAAVLMGMRPNLVPQQFTFGTNGIGYESLILRSKAPKDYSGDACLHMDGRAVFELVASVVPEDIKKCLSVNDMHLDDIDYFVFHQASNFVLNTLIQKLGITDDKKVVKCINHFGNTVSSSIPIALKTIENICKKEQLKILVSGFGAGLSWASTLLITVRDYTNA